MYAMEEGSSLSYYLPQEGTHRQKRATKDALLLDALKALLVNSAQSLDTVEERCMQMLQSPDGASVKRVRQERALLSALSQQLYDLPDLLDDACLHLDEENGTQVAVDWLVEHIDARLSTVQVQK